MNFNRFLLDNYLCTREGKKALAFFDNFEQNIRKKDYRAFFDLFSHFCIIPPNFADCKEKVDSYYEILRDIEEEPKEFSHENEEEITPEFLIDAMKDSIKAGIKEEMVHDKKTSFRDFLPSITYFSVLCHLLAPEHFFPYFFNTQFNCLEEIFYLFSVPMPPLPGKTNYEKRFDFYFELCKVLYEFRLQHNLSYQELNVVLYCFAPHCTEKIPLSAKQYPDDSPVELSAELPAPSKVYLCGADNNDTQTLEGSTSKDILCWAGNPFMRTGDLVFIYETNPVSGIRTAWRCVTDGIYDPFEYFYNRVFIGNKIELPPITLKDLKDNPLWAQKGVVKAHMQRLAGTACSYAEYQELRNMLQTKGFDTEKLPHIQFTGLDETVELQNESDVEQHLLEPFLKNIGFQKKNWVRQLPLRMGRGTKVFPDYVLFPQGTKGEEKATFVWEAKFSIHTEKQLTEAFYQAKSYALRLQSNAFGLVSKEGIWLSFASEDFSLKKLTHHTWKDLQAPDCLHTVKTVILASVKKF